MLMCADVGCHCVWCVLMSCACIDGSRQQHVFGVCMHITCIRVCRHVSSTRSTDIRHSSDSHSHIHSLVCRWFRSALLLSPRRITIRITHCRGTCVHHMTSCAWCVSMRAAHADHVACRIHVISMACATNTVMGCDLFEACHVHASMSCTVHTRMCAHVHTLDSEHTQCDHVMFQSFHVLWVLI